MAQMIPEECDLTRRPISEQIVFSVLKENLSDEWKVFHSFDYLTRDLSYKLWDGEIDFLLYHPVRGFLVIEVKGGTIAYRKGQWYQEDRKIDPVEQAKRNKYAVLNLLENKLHRTAIPMRFAHAVCFPSCSGKKVWPAEAQDIVITGDDLDSIEHFVCHLLANTPLPLSIQGVVSDAEIMQVLSPMFEYGAKLTDRMDIDEKQFFLFTEQQCAILDALEHFHRLQICGCAGSGKTIMAIKKAERLAMQGKKVLLLCYNQMLAKYLKKSVKKYNEIKADAFFEFCIDLLKVPKEQIEQYRSNPRLYSEALPKLMKSYIEKKFLCYDAVIVDEGQDFIPEAWDIISMLAAEGGDFYIFYDPDQNIYTKELKLPDFGIPPVVLNKNCRNTKKIFEALQPYQSIQSQILENTPAGADVHILHGDCLLNLERQLDKLLTYEKISTQDVVILGAHSLEHTSLCDKTQIGKYKIITQDKCPAKSEVRYFTYMKYKGCESKVVILFEVDENDPRWSDRRGIYTAMRRAMHNLIILQK